MTELHKLATLIALTSLIFGIISYQTIGMIRDLVSRYLRSKKFPSLVRAKDQDNCVSYHSWDTIALVLNGLKPAAYKVCKECGLVFGTSKRLNKPGLEVYRNSLKTRDEQQRFYDDLERKRHNLLNDAMNRIIKSFFEVKDQSDLPNNIEFMRKFFSKSVLEIDSVNDQIAKELRDGPKSN